VSGRAAAVRERPSLLRLYLLGVGALLLVQGTISLLVRAGGRDPHATTRLLSDPHHAVIHVVWGAALLLVGLLTDDPVAMEAAALIFAVFYLGLLVLGLVVHHPFGLMIDGPENAFHAIIGGLGLVLGLRDVALRRRAAGAGGSVAPG
jgi:hypothetical protein